jgi:transcriptional antiterminator Rof (Rho-off)
MTDYIPIACSDYDFLEIACMDQYEIDLQLVFGSTRGNAKQLETRSGEEYLLITKGDGAEEAVRVDQIKQLSVLTRPARFTEHQFAP